MTAAKDAPCFGNCPSDSGTCQYQDEHPDNCIAKPLVDEVIVYFRLHYPVLMAFHTAIATKMDITEGGVPRIIVGVFPPKGVGFMGDPAAGLEDQLLERFSPGVLVEAEFHTENFLEEETEE